MGNWWWGFILGLACGMSMGTSGCASEADQRQHWQDCGGVMHAECWEGHGSQLCEYEFYKECVNGG